MLAPKEKLTSCSAKASWSLLMGLPRILVDRLSTIFIWADRCSIFLTGRNCSTILFMAVPARPPKNPAIKPLEVLEAKEFLLKKLTWFILINFRIKLFIFLFLNNYLTCI